jgi:hypothetical protein
MNLQVVARFSATSEHNHECRPVIKPLRYPKHEELPENSQDRAGCEFSTCKQYLASPHPSLQQCLLATCIPESIQVSD